MPANKLLLLTGATGYIGGRLLKALEAQEDEVEESLRTATFEIRKRNVRCRPCLLRGVPEAFFESPGQGVFLGWGDPEHRSDDAEKSARWRTGFVHLSTGADWHSASGPLFFSQDEQQKDHQGTLPRLRRGFGDGLAIGLLGGEEDHLREFIGFLKEYEKS